MNFTEACNTLDIPTENRNPINLDIVKKQYRRKALQYHPDKNKSETASAEFILIKEAYHYLSNTPDNGISYDNINYANELFSFLRQSLSASNENLMQNKVFQIILTKIIECCEAKALDLLEKLDKNVLVKINETFKTYADVFHFSDGFLKSVQEIVVKKIQKDECVILNPFLDDLWENNLYRMVEKGGTFLIPLWHHELIYDNSGCDLYVKIIPVLPDNVKIDEKNNIHVDLSYGIRDLWEKSSIEFYLGKKCLRFNREKLFFKKYQKIVLFQQGISNISTHDIYDISKKSDVIINLEIEIEID
jgi:hypothetical protein